MFQRLMMVAVVALCIACPARAQFQIPVQSIYDGLTRFTLYSSGYITRSGLFLGGETVIDNGSGTRMIAGAHGQLYCLKANGNIFWWRGGMQWLMIDNGSGTARIWVDRGRIFCEKDGGQVWVCVDPYTMQWQQVQGKRDLARVVNFHATTTR